MTDINEFVKQYNQLKDDNARLQASVRAYETHADKLNKIAQDLKTISADLNPMSMFTNRRPNRQDYGDMIADLQNKLQCGATITSKLIQQTYGLSPTEAMYLSRKLRDVTVGIKVRKNKTVVELYI
jgi:hypothetical protein